MPSVTEGSVTMRGLLEIAGAAESDGGYGDLPAKVLTYNASSQLVDVQPLVMIPRAGKMKAVLPVRSLQVRFVGGNAGAFTFPLSAGDWGWIRPAGADVSAYKMRGVEQDPNAIPRSDNLNDAVFEPGGGPQGSLASTMWHATAAVLFASTELRLGDSAATELIALASKVVTELNAIRNFFDAHTHPTAATGPPSVPTLLFSAGAPVGNIASSKVKAI